MKITIRTAVEADTPVIGELVRELAEYERLASEGNFVVVVRKGPIDRIPDQHDQADVGRARDFECEGLQDARDGQDDHREDREAVEAREHASEQCARVRTRSR